MPVAAATWSSATRASSSNAMRTSGSGVSSCPPSVATPKASVRAASNQLSPAPGPDPMTFIRSPSRPPIGLSGSIEPPNMLTPACYEDLPKVTPTDLEPVVPGAPCTERVTGVPGSST